MSDQSEGQGFNDAELEDIMNEIESLEGDQNQSDTQSHETSSSPSENKQEVSENQSTEQIPANQSGNTSDTSSAQTPSKQENVLPLSNKSASSQGQGLEFEMTGEMNLKLKFNVQGEAVHVSYEQDNGLVISLDSGAKFVVPLQKKSA